MIHAFPAGPRKTDRVCRPTAPEVETNRRDALVADHLDLVRSIALGVIRRLPPAFDLDDLIATGNLALVRAAANYRPEEHTGAPFAVYARQVVRGAILDSVRRRHYTEATRQPLDHVPVIDTCELPRLDRDIDAARARIRIVEALSWLSGQEQAVIARLYSTREATAAEIARELGTTAARVSQLHEDALARLRTRFRA